MSSAAFKLLTIRTIFFIMERGISSLSGKDADITREIKALPEGYVIRMNILNYTPQFAIKVKDGKFVRLDKRDAAADLTISFKHPAAALKVLTAQAGTPQAYSENRMCVKGNLNSAMITVRCMAILQGYLYPAFINRRVMRRVPPMTPKKHMIRLAVYLLGIPFGL